MSSSSSLPFLANQPTYVRPVSDVEVLEGVARHEPLALSEAYHRTVGAAHAVVRRLTNDADQIEFVLTQVYAKLWAERPSQVTMEGWIRQAAWALGVQMLRKHNQAPVSPSTAAFLPDLPAPDTRFIDTTERAIQDLTSGQQRALVLAHDQGVPTVEQDGIDAVRHLVDALVTLAGSDVVQDVDMGLVSRYPAVADWALGIADPRQTHALEMASEEDDALADFARTLRRGRRRIEGLPATADMGARVLVRILAVAADAEATIRPTPVVDDEPLAEVEDLPVIGDEELVYAEMVEPVSVDEEPDGSPLAPVRLDEDEDALEGGLLGDDPFGDEDDSLSWIPVGNDTAGMRLVDVIAPTQDADPFGDDPAGSSAEEAMPRTAQSGRFEMITGRIGLEEPTITVSESIDFDDPTLATTQLQAIGPDGKETLMKDSDVPLNKPEHSFKDMLANLYANPAFREWVLPILVGVIVGLLLGKIING